MSEIKDTVRLLGTSYIARRDVKAFQRDDGAWFPDRTPFTMQDFRDHLAGTKTLGHYMLDADSNCKLFAYDIDLVKHNRDCEGGGCKGCPVQIDELAVSDQGNPVKTGGIFECIPRESFHSSNPSHKTLWINLRCLADGLARRIYKELGIPVAIATSGHKGLHVYGFTGLMPADATRQVALSILSGMEVFESFRGENFWRHKHEYRMLDIEVFPKQTNLDGKDLGNLMSLPLGVHRVTGNRKEFLSIKNLVDRKVSMDPMKALSGDLPWE